MQGDDGVIETIGLICAILGSILSIIGALTNNLYHDHRGAMEWWMYSNVLLLIWCAGNLGELWNGGISVGAMMLMYLIFTVSNLYGLMK
jgi:hypothetical protein